MPRPPRLPSTPFGRRLQSARQSLSLSQGELGTLIGVGNSNAAATRISRYESGTHFPDMETLFQMAKILRVPVAYLCADSDDLAQIVLLGSRIPIKKQSQAIELLRYLCIDTPLSDATSA